MITSSHLQQRLLLPPLLLVYLSVLVSAYTPTPLGLGAIFLKPPGIKTRPCLGQDDDILQAADFFTDAFWTAKIGGGAKKLSRKQQQTLYNSQVIEFKRRYGKRLGDRRAEMILCENGQKELMGVAAVEVETIPESCLTSRILTRAPLMSNVAVSKRWRRRGIAEIMVKEIERMVRLEWGYDDIYLYVEQRNKPAIRLYQKMGYKTFWTDKTAKTLVPNENGGLQNEPTTIVCMGKRLNGSIFSRLFG